LKKVMMQPPPPPGLPGALLPGQPSDTSPYPYQIALPVDGASPHRKASQRRDPKPKPLPHELDGDGPSSNAAYQAALQGGGISVSPHALGFLPTNYWLDVDASFGDLVSKFFQRKNNANCRFPHKLFNALAMVDNDPNMFHLLGVKWVTDRVFKVDKLIFGRLLGIGAIEGSLFHRQGNFPSHGFAEVSPAELSGIRAIADVRDVDHDRIRLLYHTSGGFVKASDEDSVTRCRWVSENPKQ
jgi:hypothetical protein